MNTQTLIEIQKKRNTSTPYAFDNYFSSFSNWIGKSTQESNELVNRFLIAKSSSSFTTPSFSNSPELTENLKRLDSFKLLEYDWNGYEADPIPHAVIEKAKAIIRTLDIQPEVFPTARDSVQLEYHRGDDYLEFEIFEDAIGMLEIKDGNEVEGKNFVVEQIDERIKRFHD